MKLRNKKTGEIATLTLSTNGEDMIIMGNDMYAHITKLSELKDYEDYKEPKVYYYISDFGAIRECEIGKFPEDEEDRKQIGNYFETKEEAELAVRKLKAWKRLKDKGFRFTAWYGGSKCIDWEITSLENETYIPRQICDDLDLLFGGE